MALTFNTWKKRKNPKQSKIKASGKLKKYILTHRLCCARDPYFRIVLAPWLFFPSRAIALSLVELCGFAASELAAAKMITKL